MEEAKEEHPNLVGFLERRLPELGLDSDTYGVYVLGVATTGGSNTTMDNEDEDGAESQWADIMELLQASTEEDVDESTWQELIQSIESQMKLDDQWHHQRHEELREHKRAEMQAQLDQAKHEQEQAEKQHEQIMTKNSTSQGVDEATKKAMLARFAYEDDDPDAEGDDDDDDEATPVNMNKQAAALASQEKTKELRSKKVQTKSEEQLKTKEMKANKQQLKEERRKRAVKGERKR